MTATDILAPVQLKTCRKCLNSLSVSLFSLNRNFTDGMEKCCKACVKQRNAEQYAKSRVKILHQKKVARAGDKVAFNERAKAYRVANIEKARGYDAAYKSKNKKALHSKTTVYVLKRKKVDSFFAMKLRLRAVVTTAFKRSGFPKSGKTSEILGCEWDSLKIHIERQFPKGMTWENRSEWHIDHIRPIATATTEDDVIALNHFTNLRPMWAKDNIAKSDKITHLI